MEKKIEIEINIGTGVNIKALEGLRAALAKANVSCQEFAKACSVGFPTDHITKEDIRTLCFSLPEPIYEPWSIGQKDKNYKPHHKFSPKRWSFGHD